MGGLRAAIISALAGASLPVAIICGAHMYTQWIELHRSASSTIAFIPPTTANDIWEPAHSGALESTRGSSIQIYWNGPAFADDSETQIRLLQRAVASHVLGVIIAPAQPAALLIPVQQALKQGAHLVVVGEPLSLPPSDALHYVLNDEVVAGRLLSQRLSRMLHGRGSIGVIGIDPASAGLFQRFQALQSHLKQSAPNIRIVALRFSAHSELESEQRIRELLHGEPHLGAVVALTPDATAGALDAIEQVSPQGRPLLLGAGQEYSSLYRLSQGKIDSLLADDTYQMGQVSSQALLQHSRVAIAPVLLPPILVTRDNMLDLRLTPVLTHLGGARR